MGKVIKKIMHLSLVEQCSVLENWSNENNYEEGIEINGDIFYLPPAVVCLIESLTHELQDVNEKLRKYAVQKN